LPGFTGVVTRAAKGLRLGAVAARGEDYMPRTNVYAAFAVVVNCVFR